MFVGYAREGDASQSLELQLRELSDAGCAKIFSQQNRATAACVRDALEAALDFARGGDTLVVTRLDGLAPFPADIPRIVARLAGSGVNLHCLNSRA